MKKLLGLVLLALVSVAWSQDCPTALLDRGEEPPLLTSCLQLELPASEQGEVALELPLAGGLASVEAVASAPVTVEICLLAPTGHRLQCRQGAGGVTLVDLGPPPGRYALLLRQDGNDVVPLRLRLTTAAALGDEVEPNDGTAWATPLRGGSGSSVSAAAAGLLAAGRTVGDEEDYFQFEVEGEPQLWRFEATGAGLSSLMYFDGSGVQVQRRFAPPEGDAVSMSNILLLPGRHYLAVRGVDSSYGLRAVPLGVPDQAAERESNDDRTTAEAMRLSEERRGILDREDNDVYRFTLYATERVRIELVPDDELSLRFYLDDRGTRHDSPPGEPVVLETLLLPGDHYLRVTPNPESSGSYVLRLSTLDPLALPVDVEPNDRDYLARPLGSSLVAEGVLGPDDSQDWYLLPMLGETITATVDAKGEVALTFYRLDGAARHQIAYLAHGVSGQQVELPAGEDLRFAVSGAGSYRVAIDAGELAEEESAAELNMSIGGPADPAAAYWHHGQRITTTVAIANPTAGEQEVELLAVSSHYGWRPVLAESRLTLAPGEARDVPLVVEVLPDARDDLDVRVTVQALPVTDASEAAPSHGRPLGEARGGRVRLQGPTASASFSARCGVPPISPAVMWGMPDALLGGVNLAWDSLGGRVSSGEGGGQARLIDGIVAPSTGWTSRVGGSVTLMLGGDGVPLSGVLLNPYSDLEPAERLADFELQASNDGESFEPVLRARLDPAPIEQAFLFGEPITARYLRLVVLSNQAGDFSGRASLGEIKVIATPQSGIFAIRGANLSESGVGGYVVWSRPSFRSSTDPFGQGQPHEVHLDKEEERIEWVLGFHNNRAARVAALEWEAAPVSPDYPSLERVEVAVSLTSPVGPWHELGHWDTASEPVFSIEGEPWVRFVRFSANELQGGEGYRMPLDVRVREVPEGGAYRSILGEWGQSRREASYEALERPNASVALAERDDNDTRERAQALSSGQIVTGRVVIGEDVDWYRLTVPAGENSLSIALAGEPVLGVRYELFDEQGEPVLFDVTGSSEQLTLSAFVEPGDYYLLLEEPPRSVVFAWDNSGSMSDYLDIIYQTVTGFVSEVQPGREAAQLLAFEEDPRGVFLLPEWSDVPLELMAALNNYDRSAGSSNAEANLLAATRALGEREGSRAIMLMTDAESGGHNLTARLWTELERVRPRIFTFETSSAGSAHTQDLMQSWADVAGGHYAYARGVGDFEAGFARATCHLRRPAHYRLEVDTAFREPPGPGLLSVVNALGVAGNPPVEIVLDLSGSMSRPLPGGATRVEVAKRALIDLVEGVLPEGTPFALRIYGHVRPNSCDTRLEQPLGPLDPDRVRSLVGGVQPQLLSGTPLAASLQEVPRDLMGGTDGATVILLTDGEESCGGDLEMAVRSVTAAGVDVQLHIVSFDIESAEAKAEFERLAGVGGGRFFDANDEAGLAAALRAALQPTFEVLGPDGGVIATGTVGGEPLPLAPGIYKVSVPGEPLAEVRIRGDDAVEILVGGDRP